ncbi:hypothetical protein HPB52_003836 [Rhipicephalus sanguineus]|uniref:Uncharacterized protein n=1 Tax=Rhipicephalus sanguineus TaxID=34632 RepID=A0A9D4PU13_RHISA|nr:hypothetical protein HPB52_003836 [Rhipicephalus sanguineus]
MKQEIDEAVRSIRMSDELCDLFAFIAGFGFSYQDAENEKSLESLSMSLRNIEFDVLMVFVPAATVYATTQGINHFIFPRLNSATSS